MPRGEAVDHGKELVKLIGQLSHKYSVWHVFEDFVAMAAISISNTVDWLHREARQATYTDIAAKYDTKDGELFPQMMVHLVGELERHTDSLDDVLGSVFHELELHNKYKGQFFTPQCVCNFMGIISLADSDPAVTEKGHLTVCEPCAGSGAMILGFANAMQKNGFDYQRQMVVTATDIDLKCVYMSYLQMSLYGIPAVVIHGNSLTLQEWSRWYTPVYMIDGWVWRQTCGNLDRRYPEDEAIKRLSNPMYAAIRETEALTVSTAIENGETASMPPESVITAPRFNVNLHEAANGQLSFDL